MLVVSENYLQKFSEWRCELSADGRCMEEGGVSGATANLGICDKGGQVLCAQHSLIVCLHIPATP
jgi:hypothetical protein